MFTQSVETLRVNAARKWADCHWTRSTPWIVIEQKSTPTTRSKKPHLKVAWRGACERQGENHV